MNIQALPATNHPDRIPAVDDDHLRARTKYFDFHRAAPKPLYADALQLRFQVYCLERGFLSPADYPEGQEHDDFDKHAVHFLARHRVSLQPAGTIRLVQHSPLGFPLLQHCRIDDEYQQFFFDNELGLRRFGEISRLAVSRHYRQRTTDTVFGGPPRRSRDSTVDAGCDPSDCPETAGPEIIAGLYKCIYQECKRRAVTHFLVAMERSLQVLLKRLTIRFVPIGPEVDYYGPVRPYLLSLRQLEQDIWARRPEVLRYWLQGLPTRFWPEVVLPHRADGSTRRDARLKDGAEHDEVLRHINGPQAHQTIGDLTRRP